MLQSMGSLESDTTERLHFHFSLSRIGEGNGVLAWRIPGKGKFHIISHNREMGLERDLERHQRRQGGYTEDSELILSKMGAICERRGYGMAYTVKGSLLAALCTVMG